MINRVWRDVAGLEDRYEVSNDGLVRAKARILRPCALKNGGHLQVVIGGKSVYVHRLVAVAFLDNPEGKRVVHHRNSDPTDNRVDNLQWATHSENNLHAYRENNRQQSSCVKVVGTTPQGSRATFPSITTAARFMRVSKSSILSALNNRHKCGYMSWERL